MNATCSTATPPPSLVEPAMWVEVEIINALAGTRVGKVRSYKMSGPAHHKNYTLGDLLLFAARAEEKDQGFFYTFVLEDGTIVDCYEMAEMKLLDFMSKLPTLPMEPTARRHHTNPDDRVYRLTLLRVAHDRCPRHFQVGIRAGPHAKGEVMCCGCCAGTCHICIPDDLPKHRSLASG